VDELVAAIKEEAVPGGQLEQEREAIDEYLPAGQTEHEVTSPCPFAFEVVLSA